MKATFLTFILLAFAAFVAPGFLRAQDAPPPPPDAGVSYQTFYDQLSPDGSWIQTDQYGYVFQPNVTDPSWAPYTNGHWVYTDQGWTWASNDPWGWATDHYGRWANIDDLGWVWVPGTTWAPAWVSWRYGNGYAGWAPLPPESLDGEEEGPDYSESGDFAYGDDVDVNFDIGPECYNFVPVTYLGDPDYRGHYYRRDHNFELINRTQNVTNMHVNRQQGVGAFNRVAAGGPPINEVNAHAHRHLQTMTLAAANQPGRSTVQGNALAVYAPTVNRANAAQAHPAAVARTVNHPTFNHGDSAARPLAVTATVKPAAPSAATIQAAEKAQRQAPATARIATPRANTQAEVNSPAAAPAATGEVHHDNSFTGEPAENHPAPASPVVHPSEANGLTGEPQQARAETQASQQQSVDAQVRQRDAEMQAREQQQAQTQNRPQPQAEVQAPQQQSVDAQVRQRDAEMQPREQQQAPAEVHSRAAEAPSEAAPEVVHHEAAPAAVHSEPSAASHPAAAVVHASSGGGGHPDASADHAAASAGGGGDKPQGH